MWKRAPVLAKARKRKQGGVRPFGSPDTEIQVEASYYEPRRAPLGVLWAPKWSELSKAGPFPCPKKGHP